MQLRETGEAYELTNGLTGVRILKPGGNQSPFNKAPIQGVRLADNFHGNGGALPCGLIENRLYWPLTRTYDRGSNQTTFTLSEAKGGTRVDISCGPSGRPYAQETMNLAGAGYFKETISVYAGPKFIQHTYLALASMKSVFSIVWLRKRQISSR